MLTDAPAGVGGFGCVPGSHKTNFSSHSIPDAIRSFEQAAPYVEQVTSQAGDAILFTEALIHGTMPCGETHHWSKLSDDEVIRIHSLATNSSLTQKEIAAKFGITAPG